MRGQRYPEGNTVSGLIGCSEEHFMSLLVGLGLCREGGREGGREENIKNSAHHSAAAIHVPYLVIMVSENLVQARHIHAINKFIARGCLLLFTNL